MFKRRRLHCRRRLLYTTHVANRQITVAAGRRRQTPRTHFMEFDQQFVEFIVKALVNHPEEVRSERKVDEQGVLITVHTSPDDTGYVIGKGGKTAVAIRTLLATIGAKGNLRVSFRIDAPETAGRRPRNEAPAQEEVLDDSAVDSLTF